MPSSLYAMGIRVKVDSEFGGIGISHEESICTLRYNRRVYGRGTGTSICVGAGFQCIFYLIRVDDVNFAS